MKDSEIHAMGRHNKPKVKIDTKSTVTPIEIR